MINRRFGFLFSSLFTVVTLKSKNAKKEQDAWWCGGWGSSTATPWSLRLAGPPWVSCLSYIMGHYGKRKPSQALARWSPFECWGDSWPRRFSCLCFNAKFENPKYECVWLFERVFSQKLTCIYYFLYSFPIRILEIILFDIKIHEFINRRTSI